MFLILGINVALFLSSANATSLEQLCATSTAVGSTSQSDVLCGSTYVVRKSPMFVKHRDGFQVLLSVGAIFQLSQDGLHLRITRGNALVRGSMLEKSLQIETPMARAEFTEGATLLSVDPKSRSTQIGSVSGSVSVQNRFVSRAAVLVEPSEMTELTPLQTSLHPHRPEPMDVATVRAIVNSVGTTKEESDEFASLVSAERERRERHFAENFEVWRGMQPDREGSRTLAAPISVDAVRKPSRSIASVPAVDSAEQAHFEKNWSKHLLGDEVESPEKLLRPQPKRKPASLAKKATSVEEDPLFKEEKARVLNSIQGGNHESLDPDPHPGHRK